MNCVKVNNQEELDAAARRGDCAHVHSGSVHAYDSATVQAYDSATVQASGSATVQAYDSATVQAYDSATVQAYDSATVQATPYVAVTVHGVRTKVTGGVRIDLPEITTAEAWCEFYGVQVADGVATLFKALNGDYVSGYGCSYAPGSTPVAKDWDGGRQECGGGLHFSPRPFSALRFAGDAVRFVACPVALADIRPPKPGDLYGDKVKARGCAGPVWECDIDGEPIKAEAAS